MKEKRQNAILEIVENQNIETQEELGRQLLARGFRVTQATISRDIKDMHLIKVQTEQGVYRYAVNEQSLTVNTEKLLRVFKETVLSVKGSGNIIVVTTMTGSANAAAEVLDNMELDGVIGTLAGDNTIFIAVQTNRADSVISQLKQLLRG